MKVEIPQKLTKDANRPYSCTLCGKNFARRSSYQGHKLIHKQIMPYMCEICGECFWQEHSLMKHMLNHTGEKKFQCKVCTKTFTLQATLYKHMIVHNIVLHGREKYYTCDSCGRAFGRKAACIHHLDTHKKEKNLLPGFSCKQKNLYKCQRCKQVLDEEVDLHAHDCKKKMFVCKICGIPSTKKSTLSNHMKSHKKRQCPVRNKTKLSNLSNEKNPVPSCMKRSMCIKCKKRMHISVNKIGEPSSYLCKSCMKKINKKIKFNLGQCKSVTEILKILGDSPLKVGASCNNQILKQEGKNMEECTNNDTTKFHKSEDDKEILDIGQHFLDYRNNESQMVLPVESIKEECD